MVTGGPEEYDGIDMRETNAHLVLSEGDFAAIANHLDRPTRAKESLKMTVGRYYQRLLNWMTRC
jgi:uncharacterized protein (DUF1778 family)